MSGLSATLPRLGLRPPPSQQPPSSAQPARTARRLIAGRGRLTLTGGHWLTLPTHAWLALIVHAWRRRRAFHVLLADVPVEFIARSEHQATPHALLSHRWLLSQHRNPRRLRAAPAGAPIYRVDQLDDSGKGGRRIPLAPDVTVLAVRWYLRFELSNREVEELLAERHIEVDHVAIYRWGQRYTPLLADAARPCRHAVGDRWQVDETYVRVGGHGATSTPRSTSSGRSSRCSSPPAGTSRRPPVL
jgi:hypothetical protein